TSGSRQRFRSHDSIAGGGHLGQHGFIPIGLEVEIDAIGGYGCFRSVGSGDQAGVSAAVDLLRQTIVIELHGEFVGGVAQLAIGIVVAAVGTNRGDVVDYFILQFDHDIAAFHDHVFA